ncbi:protein arginine kinase [Clostridium intestinale]|uniref:Protein-arginine kinase n=1 Tax=Clostridium intestinale TaxID=36845 RepID=A0A7D6ZZU4_9CLOT|nr:protein arginine kinase [Clostridium intestinale]QLY79575.1 protein arginine kinase [Clostridium intestinale]
MESWINSSKEDVVISSRVRLARNVKEVPFPNKLDNENGIELSRSIQQAFNKVLKDKGEYKTYELRDISPNLARTFLEKHLISPNLIKNGTISSFIVDSDETFSLMINEEDHIRLQCITAGFDIRSAYNNADEVDSLLEQEIEYAFNEKLGYLTACPTNIGTAMRASVMIHLPAATFNNEIPKLLKGLNQVGMTLRGLYGEGSKGEGNIYQISNQVTLGVTDEDILTNLEAVALQVVAEEKNIRKLYLDQYKYEVEDRIFRARALLENARVLTLKEALGLLSSIRLGVEEGLIEDIDIKKVNKMLLFSQNASLQNHLDRELKERERNIERAKLMRSILSES